MLDWIREHYSTISALTNIGMLIVWIAYLQLFLASYKRQRRAKILINVGAGRSLEARCLLSNMSAEAIYVESLIATVQNNEERWTCPVTDVERLRQDQEPPDPRQMTRQGPLKPGEVMDLGSFGDLISRVVRDSGWSADNGKEFPDGLTALEIRAIADYASEDLLVGAKRRFELLKRNGRWLLAPDNSYTEQIRSRRERKKIRPSIEEIPRQLGTGDR